MDLLSRFNAQQQVHLSNLGVRQPILHTAAPAATAAAAAAAAPRALGGGMGAQAAAAAAASHLSSAQATAQKGKSQPRAQPDAPQAKSRMPQPIQPPPRPMQANPYAQQQQPKPVQMQSPQLASSAAAAASSDQYAASILGLAPPPAAAAAAASSAPSASSDYSAANELFGSKHATQSSQPAMLGSAFPSSPAPTIGGPSLSIGGPGPMQRNGAAASPSSGSAATSAAVAAAASSVVSFARPATATFDALQCPECPPGAEVIVDAHQGVEVCTNCGLVIGQVISEESEWRTFSDRRGADPNRVGGPEIGLLADAGLATLMGDSPNGLGSTLAKLQNKSAMSHNHRLLLDSFRKSSAFSTRLTLPRSLTDRSDELYKKVVDSKLVVHRGSDALIAACLFAVCQAENVPRTLKEVIGATDVRKKDLGRCYKDMKRLGFLKSLRAAAVEGGAASSSSADGSMRDSESDMASYIARWGSHLALDKRLVKLAQDIVANTNKVVLPSSEPSTKCGAALWIATQCGNANEHKSFEDVSAVCGMATETIRKLVRLFLEPDRKRVMIPEQFWDVAMQA